MKTYFGKGKMPRGSETIDITLNVEELLQVIAEHSFEYGGKRYLKAVVAKRWKPTEYGHTHSVFVQEVERQSYNDRLIDEQERRE